MSTAKYVCKLLILLEKQKMLKKLGIIYIFLLLGSCSKQPGDGIEGTQNYEGQQFPITVHVFDTRAQLQKAIEDINNRGEEVDGFSAWYLRSKADPTMTRCDLYVVRPSSVNDHSQMTTWGHELAHCVYGTYHKEGQR
jgi:hypothetical protein